MKESTKSIIEFAIKNEDRIDVRAAENFMMALKMGQPEADPRNGGRQSEPLLLKLNDAAKILGVGRVTFWRLVSAGAIRPVEIFEGVFRYNYNDLLNFSEQRSSYSPKARGKANLIVG